MEAMNSALLQLGWKPFFRKQVSAEEGRKCQPVRVMTVHRGMVSVVGDGFGCAIRAAIEQKTLELARFQRWRKLTSEDVVNTQNAAVRRLRHGNARKRK